MSDEMFVALRKAHRFVVAYNRRLLNAAQKLNNIMVESGFNDGSFKPIFTASAPGPKSWKGRWAWDSSPLLAPRFSWIKGPTNKPGHKVVFVEHIADTGLSSYSGNTEPDPLNLKPPEEANSIWIVRWLHMTARAVPFPDDLWRQYWHDIIPKHFSDSKNVFHYNINDTKNDVMEKEGVRYGYQFFEAKELVSPDDFDSKLIRCIMELLEGELS